MNLRAIYASQRMFEVWRWGVGHAGLLLRGNPAEGFPTRIEIIFKPAYAVCLPSVLRTLLIQDKPEDVLLATAQVALGRPLTDWEHLYKVDSGDAHGWVVGGTVAGREDDQGYEAPTMFDGWAPRAGVRTLFMFESGERKE